VETTVQRLAYEAALRALDRQERLAEELRSRTAILLGAASVATSFLGPAAIDRGSPAVVAVAVGTFAIVIAASLVVLLPSRRMVFALSGIDVYERLIDLEEDPEEAHRRLAFDLTRFWHRNDRRIAALARVQQIAVAALLVEVALLVAALGGTLS
jgi:hypothetical protein